MRVHDFEGVVAFVRVGHHAEVVCDPNSTEVDETVSAHPLPVTCQEVEAMNVHVVDHPLEALSVVIVPGAVTTTLLGPQIDHLSCVVGGVGHGGGDRETEDHVNHLAVIVAEVLVDPEEEPLVLVEGVEGHESGPE